MKKLEEANNELRGHCANLWTEFKRLSAEKLSDIFNTIKRTKEEENWKVRITITDWDIVNEGHAILIHPDGEVVASPVPSKPNCIEPFGNILEEDFPDIFKRMRTAIPHPLHKQCPGIDFCENTKNDVNSGMSAPISFKKIEKEWQEMFERI